MSYARLAPALLLLACTENNLSSNKEPDGLDTSGDPSPDIAVSPAAVRFGEVAWGSENTATVTITNEGQGILLLDSPSLENGGAALTVSRLASPSLAAGESTELVVTWLATDGGSLDDVLDIGSNDPDEPVVGVPIGGSLPPGDIVVTPTAYDFGTIPVAATDSTVVTVSNVGAGPLTVSSMTFSATDADLAVFDAGALATTPVVLDPGGSTEMIVTYTPTDGTGDEGTLAIFSDDPDTDEAGTVFTGKGEDPDPCLGLTQHVKVTLTADDAWQGWMDSVAFSAPGQNAWNQIDAVEWDLPCGDHALALYATDTAQVIAGVLAAVEIEGTVKFVSGPTDWTMFDSAPPADWTDAAFDDSAWHIPEQCSDPSPWGSQPQPLYDLGATWIWWTANCRDLGEAWVRLNFTVP